MRPFLFIVFFMEKIMSRDPMPVPFLYRILFFIDFLACLLYGYILGYLIKDQGSSFFTLEWTPDRIGLFLAMGVVFFGLIGNFKMLRGRIRALVFCYINWLLGVGFFLTGFFSPNTLFATLPNAIPDFVSLPEWLAGDIFSKTLFIRSGFFGLYLVALLKTSSVYSYFSRIQKEQIEKDRSGDSVGSFRQQQLKMGMPDSPNTTSPVLHHDVSEPPMSKPVFYSPPKAAKRGFFRKIFSAISMLFLLNLGIGIGLYFFSPETIEKIHKHCQTYFPVVKDKAEKMLGEFLSDSSIKQYRQLLENPISFSVSSSQGTPYTLTQAIEEICILAKIPYLDRKIQAGQSKVGAIVLKDAKASAILDILVGSKEVKYDLCPKGLYLKESQENTVDWNSLEPTQKTIQFLGTKK